jgi:formyl-CoA transferase
VTTRDGEMVYLAIQNPREWVRLCTDVLKQPDLAADARFATNPMRVANRDALDKAIATAVDGLTAAELVRRLDAAQIAHARMNTMADFVAHPQLSARDRWRDIDTPAGPVKSLVPPVTVGQEAPRLGAVPALGAHTEPILRELGFGAEAVAAWRAEGTI